MNDDLSEITTKPSPKFSWLHILIVLLVAVLAGGGVWLYYELKVLPDLENKAEVTGVTPKRSETNTESTKQKQQEAQKVVDQFESLHKIKDEVSVSQMFDLFTPVSTQAEKESYNFLMGIDLPNQSSRLINTASYSYKLASYQINKSEGMSNGFKITVLEKKSVYDNTTLKWSDSQQNKIFEVVQSSGKWLIDKYYNEGVTGDISSMAQKYEGFNNE